METNNNIYKVSVIVPVYNSESYLHRCVDSILSQTLKEIEIILVDDGSTDGSAKICDEYLEKYENIKVIHQENSGPSKARNVGLQHAKGEYIGFVDSDDYLAADMYQTLYDVAAKESIDIVTCDSYIVKNGEQLRNNGLELPANKLLNFNEIRNILTVANKIRILWFSWKSIYKSEIIGKNNIMYPQLKMGEDTVFVLDFLLNSKSMYYIDKPYYFYEQTPNSLTRVKYKENYLEQLEGLYFAKENIYLKHKFDNYKKDLNEYTMKHTISLLLENEYKHKRILKDKINVYRNIRNSDMIKRAFKGCSISVIKSKLKYFALLLKFRLYLCLALITN